MFPYLPLLIAYLRDIFSKFWNYWFDIFRKMARDFQKHSKILLTSSKYNGHFLYPNKWKALYWSEFGQFFRKNSIVIRFSMKHSFFQKIRYHGYHTLEILCLCGTDFSSFEAPIAWVQNTSLVENMSLMKAIRNRNIGDHKIFWGCPNLFGFFLKNKSTFPQLS